MHKIAEAGVASHWLYKSSDASLSELQKKTHQWLQSLLEMQSQSGDSVEFLEHLKVDLFPDEVYVFTPKGKIMSLPRGATAVDFAYAVHTDIGNRCVAVKINQELMPLRTELKNGDRVEIITAAHAKPNPLWLNFVITGKARSHIRHFLKTMHFGESAQLGERLLNQALTGLGSGLAEIKDAQWEKFLRDAGEKSRQEVMRRRRARQAAGSSGGAPAAALGDPGPHERAAARLRHHPRLGRHGGAVRPLLQADSRAIPIIGVISKGQGMVIHTHDCPVIARARHDPDRVLDVAWDPETRKPFDVSIKLVVANQRGVLAKVAAEIAEARVQYPERRRRPGRRQRIHQHAVHAAGVQPPASRADRARPAGYPRGHPHFTPERLVPFLRRATYHRFACPGASSLLTTCWDRRNGT